MSCCGQLKTNSLDKKLTCGEIPEFLRPSLQRLLAGTPATVLGILLYISFQSLIILLWIGILLYISFQFLIILLWIGILLFISFHFLIFKSFTL